MPIDLDENTRQILDQIAREFGTPCYVYFADRIRRRYAQLLGAFGDRFGISYAAKANPNRAILECVKNQHCSLDVSSIGEVDAALKAGFSAESLSFSGPAKRTCELKRAIELGVGEMVCESRAEIEILDRLAYQQGRLVKILVRINPKKMPHGFGINMAGKPSQFGIDEEVMDDLLPELPRFKSLDVSGFHIYSGTNSLSLEAIAENFAIFIELFLRFSASLSTPPNKLVFGSGFGVPYYPTDTPLDIIALAARINPQIDNMKLHPALKSAKCILEMGRWLVGPCGFLLTTIVNSKNSRGTEIRLCDAGFNNHLAACGMMGTIIRRNWQFWKVSKGISEPKGKYSLVGPLCTTIDTLATDVELPPLNVGDVLAVGSSGAYGLTASPTQFISHPVPREILVEGEPDAVAYLDISDCQSTPFRTSSYPNSSDSDVAH